jgi:hypothetical protein
VTSREAQSPRTTARHGAGGVRHGRMQTHSVSRVVRGHVGPDPHLGPAHRVFIRMWGVAALAHLAGNPFYANVVNPATLLGFALLAVGLLATAVVVAPRRGPMLALCTAMPVSAALQAPQLGNHWLLAAIVSLAYLATAGRWEPFWGTARVLTLGFYAFAAFAKLNEGFLDPATSCAVFYADQAARAMGLGPLAGGGAGTSVLVWMAAAIELSVVPLVLVVRTRKVGVVLAVTFHSALTFDLAQHFYDFTSVLLALFVLFLDDGFAQRFEARPRWLTPTGVRVCLQLVAFIGVITTLANVTPLVQASAWFLRHVTLVWWFPYMGYVLVAVFRSQADRQPWRVPVVGWAFFLVVVANGLTPYLEVKTAFSWNMYSNLQVVNGSSNHVLVRVGVPLRASHEDMVEVVSADGAELKPYVGSGYLVAWPSFREYTSRHLDEAVTYRRGGQVIQVSRIRDDPTLASPTPAWWRWVPIRSVRADGVASCQPAFLPAL